MSRLTRAALSLFVVVASTATLASAPALAKTHRSVLKVTGAQTTITPSTHADAWLTTHNVSMTAVGPASASGGALTLPITQGRLRLPGFHGRLVHSGGVQFAAGTRTVTLTNLVLVRPYQRAYLWATAGSRLIPVAQLTNLSVKVSSATAGTLSGELRLSGKAARLINRLAGKKVVHAGADLGALTSSVTVA